MIIAITGGTGFIGRKLALHHLARGDEVRVLSRRKPGETGLPDAIRLCHGDLTHHMNLLPFVADADVLYHCAGEIRDAGHMDAVHVEGTRRLLEAAAGKIGRWVQLSSVGVYGQHREGTVTEETAANPCGTYETSKAQSDALVETAGIGGAFSYAILRPSNVYAPEMTNRSLFGLISMVERGWFFFIGKPGASANYVHADNVVEALLLCATVPHAAGRVYNLSDYCTIEEFISIIARELGREPPRMRFPEAPIRLAARLLGKFPGAPLTEARVDALTGRSVYTTARINQALGYLPAVSMADGLAGLVEFWLRTSGKSGKQ